MLRELPDYMWSIYYRMFEYKLHLEYESVHKRQGELISSITSPENFKTYLDIQEQERKGREQGGPHNVTVRHKDGVSASSTSNTYFDPEKGLVTWDGKVLIDKKTYVERANQAGLMISL